MTGSNVGDDCTIMSEEVGTPRRSARIVHKASALKPVASYKTNHPYTWPKAPLPPKAVQIDDRDAFLGKDASNSVRFYSEIYRNITPARSKTRHEVFALGDTILVNNRTSRFPSVGVIVALWQPERDEDEEDDNESGGQDAERGCICVHWFVQPGELAQVRAAREHAPVSLFSVLLTSLLTNYFLLSRTRYTMNCRLAKQYGPGISWPSARSPPNPHPNLTAPTFAASLL